MSDPIWIFQGSASCERCRALVGEHYEKPPMPPLHPHCRCYVTKRCEGMIFSEPGGMYFDDIAVYMLIEIYIECCDGTVRHVGTDRIGTSHERYWSDPEEVQSVAAELALDTVDLHPEYDYSCPEVVAGG